MRRLPSILLLPLLIGCSDPASISEDLQVNFAVTPTVFRAGARAIVTTTVSNTGRRSWQIGAETMCGDLFVVKGPDGKIIPPTWFTCLRATVATIEPGQRIEFAEDFWTHLAPGIYQVGTTMPAGVGSQWVRVEITP